jgi:hypothetical protein
LSQPASPPPPPRTPAPQKLSVFGRPWPLEPALLRVRLRYVRNTAEMLRWAEQMQDDGMPRSAAELMRLAVEEDPSQRPLWQYLLARAFEDHDVPEFASLREAFVGQFPNDPALPELTSMVHRLSCDDAIAPETWRTTSFFHREGSGQRSLHAQLIETGK